VWLGLLCAVAMISRAQTAAPVWGTQDSGTTAGLRGIDSVDGTVAWASGTGGTVTRTVDGGARWTKCVVPDGDKDWGRWIFAGCRRGMRRRRL
jgi:hypothetical protein